MNIQQKSKTTKKKFSDQLPVNAISARSAAIRKLDLVIRVTGLAKTFDNNAAVDTIDFTVPRGVVYGIVGPNGAGKTTTMLMMAGLLRPDTGRITVDNKDVWTDPSVSKQLIGVMPDRFDLFDRLTGWQCLYYAGTLRGMDAESIEKRSHELVKMFGLQRAINRRAHDYSAGMMKKLGLACAMIHCPKVLILDEPFESVDPVTTRQLVRVLRDLAEDGVTTVMSSHDMNVISQACDFLAIIVDGRVLDQGQIDLVLGGKTLEERFLDLTAAKET